MGLAFDAFARAREPDLGPAMSTMVRSESCRRSRADLVGAAAGDRSHVRNPDRRRSHRSSDENDYLAGLDAGAQLFANVLRAIGKHQRRLGCDIQRDLRIEENLPNRLAGARPARLMGDADGAAFLVECCGERRGFGGFSGPSTPLPT